MVASNEIRKGHDLMKKPGWSLIGQRRQKHVSIYLISHKVKTGKIDKKLGTREHTD